MIIMIIINKLHKKNNIIDNEYKVEQDTQNDKTIYNHYNHHNLVIF